MSLPFQEPDLTRMGASFSPIPALEQLSDLARQARQIHGIDSQFGLRLSRVFQDAGLPTPELTCDAFIGTGLGWGGYDQIPRAAKNALPVVLSSTAAGHPDIDGLAEQVRAAVRSQRSVTRAIDLISAWAGALPR